MLGQNIVLTPGQSKSQAEDETKSADRRNWLWAAHPSSTTIQGFSILILQPGRDYSASHDIPPQHGDRFRTRSREQPYRGTRTFSQANECRTPNGRFNGEGGIANYSFFHIGTLSATANSCFFGCEGNL
jgi:hypothetical protein